MGTGADLLWRWIILDGRPVMVTAVWNTVDGIRVGFRDARGNVDETMETTLHPERS